MPASWAAWTFSAYRTPSAFKSIAEKPSIKTSSHTAFTSSIVSTLSPFTSLSDKAYGIAKARKIIARANYLSIFRQPIVNRTKPKMSKDIDVVASANGTGKIGDNRPMPPTKIAETKMRPVITTSA